MDNSKLAKKINNSVLVNIFGIINKSNKKMLFGALVKSSSFKKELILEVLNNNKELFIMYIPINKSENINDCSIELTEDGSIMYDFLMDNLATKIVNSII